MTERAPCLEVIRIDGGGDVGTRAIRWRRWQRRRRSGLQPGEEGGRRWWAWWRDRWQWRQWRGDRARPARPHPDGIVIAAFACAALVAERQSKIHTSFQSLKVGRRHKGAPRPIPNDAIVVRIAGSAIRSRAPSALPGARTALRRDLLASSGRAHWIGDAHTAAIVLSPIQCHHAKAREGWGRWGLIGRREGQRGRRRRRSRWKWRCLRRRRQVDARTDAHTVAVPPAAGRGAPVRP